MNQQIESDKKHGNFLLHPVSQLHELEKTGPLTFVKGQGCKVWDIDGKEYIDATAGLWVVAVGHGRSVLAEAAKNQINRIAYAPTFFGMANQPALDFSEKLAEITPENLTRFHFISGGSEANESAIKIARHYWNLQGFENKIGIISRRHSYHGISIGTMSATAIPAYQKRFGPLAPGFYQIDAAYCYRCPFDRQYPHCKLECAEALEKKILELNEENVAAFIAEPVFGAGGVMVPPAEYFPRVQEICKKHNILLIADEVITGFGRTGSMFAVEHWKIEPDLMTMAKGITSGYIPLGAVGLNQEIYNGIKNKEEWFMHGFTFSGHPVACRVGLENTRIIEHEKLAARAEVMGKYLLEQLRKLKDLPFVGDVRGIGLMAAVELVENKEAKTKAPSNITNHITIETRKDGVLCRAVRDQLILLSPPLTITSEEVDIVVKSIRRAITSFE
jgi:adenosylmethionine-8-amino-7-oxononanoate aminotransferase